jgi:hypothetical protein
VLLLTRRGQSGVLLFQVRYVLLEFGVAPVSGADSLWNYNGNSFIQISSGGEFVGFHAASF